MLSTALSRSYALSPPTLVGGVGGWEKQESVVGRGVQSWAEEVQASLWRFPALYGVRAHLTCAQVPGRK